ncbi:hypothetical protein J6590_030462 [Homalodisca vitripennis]|nr:hypothetical protein J6590_030462 [Homalodisca vitripennis]
MSSYSGTGEQHLRHHLTHRRGVSTFAAQIARRPGAAMFGEETRRTQVCAVLLVRRRCHVYVMIGTAVSCCGLRNRQMDESVFTVDGKSEAFDVVLAKKVEPSTVQTSLMTDITRFISSDSCVWIESWP